MQITGQGMKCFNGGKRGRGHAGFEIFTVFFTEKQTVRIAQRIPQSEIIKIRILVLKKIFFVAFIEETAASNKSD